VFSLHIQTINIKIHLLNKTKTIIILIIEGGEINLEVGENPILIILVI